MNRHRPPKLNQSMRAPRRARAPSLGAAAPVRATPGTRTRRLIRLRQRARSLPHRPRSRAAQPGSDAACHKDDECDHSAPAGLTVRAIDESRGSSHYVRCIESKAGQTRWANVFLYAGSGTLPERSKAAERAPREPHANVVSLRSVAGRVPHRSPPHIARHPRGGCTRTRQAYWTAIPSKRRSSHSSPSRKRRSSRRRRTTAQVKTVSGTAQRTWPRFWRSWRSEARPGHPREATSSRSSSS